MQSNDITQIVLSKEQIERVLAIDEQRNKLEALRIEQANQTLQLKERELLLEEQKEARLLAKSKA